jgi:predicted DNA-binding transcriptional regulator AlpA
MNKIDPYYKAAGGSGSCAVGPESQYPLLVNLSEAARVLGVSRTRFWQLRKRGLIPTVVLEGVRYVRSRDLDDIVRKLQHSEVSA